MNVVRGQDQKFDLKYVHPNATAACFIRPMQLAQNPTFKKFLALLDQFLLKEMAGLSLTQLEEVKIVFVDNQALGRREPNPAPFSAVFIVRTTDASAAASIYEKLSSESGFQEKMENEMRFRFKGNAISPSGDRGNLIYKVDDRTLLLTDSIISFASTPDLKTAATTKPIWSDKFDLAKGLPFLVAFDTQKVTKIAEATKRPGPQPAASNPMLSAASILWEKSQYALVALDTKDKIKLNAMTHSSEEDNAKQISEVLYGYVALAKGALPGLKPMLMQMSGNNSAVAAKIEDMLTSFVDGVKITQKSSDVFCSVTIEPQLLELAQGPLLSGIMAAREAARNNTLRNKIRQLGLGVMTFLEANKRFPDTTADSPQMPAMSWRVRILPYIEQKALYDEYKKDEPWDSENNKKVLAKMPDAYRHPDQDATSINTSFFRLAGAEGLAPGGQNPIKMKNVSDGLSKTLLIVEAEREVPWTKPDDIEVVKGQTPELGRKKSDFFMAITSDGAVHTISKKIDAESFWAIFTRAGGEIVDWSKFEVQFSPVPPQGAR
jgi:hypothetical protein